MENSVFINKLMKAGIVFCVLISISYCLWMLDRGFEITDEAYYLLLSIHPQAVTFFISAAQWFTSTLWQITGSLYGFRAIGMGLLLFSSLLLANGTVTACIRCNLMAAIHFSERMTIIASTFVAALFYATILNFSPSYNLLATAGAYAAAGLVLFTANNSDCWRNTLLCFLAGGALSIELICKGPAGIDTLCVVLIVAAVLSCTRRDKIMNMAMIIVGLCAFTLAIILMKTTIAESINTFNHSLALFKLVQTETVSARLLRYYQEILHVLSVAAITFAIPFIAFLLYAFTRYAVFIFIGLVVLGYILISGHYLQGGFDRYPTEAISLFVILTLGFIASFPVWIKNWNIIVLLGSLFILPYSVAVGTSNPLSMQILFSLASWGTLIAVLAFADIPKEHSKIPAALIALVFVSSMSFQLISSMRDPYHLGKPLTQQSYPVSVGNLGVIKMDAQTQLFVSDITQAAQKCHILPGRPFLGLYNDLGVALILQTIPPSTPWLNNQAQANMMMAFMSPDTLHSAVIALELNPDGSRPLLPTQLSAFPGGYKLCGTATYPYQKQEVQIWVARWKLPR
ncbi:MAG TPA: hypothetical protein VGV92_02525 [Gammaproteobacteria bacterium]|nr:hypothetical protein [Gammaproteobacteria bacterium]